MEGEFSLFSMKNMICLVKSFVVVRWNKLLEIYKGEKCNSVIKKMLITFIPQNIKTNILWVSFWGTLVK